MNGTVLRPNVIVKAITGYFGFNYDPATGEAVGPQWRTGSADPTTGDGVAAPLGSKYTRVSGGTATEYLKTGAGATQWTLLPLS